MKFSPWFSCGVLMLALLTISSGCGRDGDANASHPSASSSNASSLAPGNSTPVATAATTAAATETRSAEQVLKDMESVYAKANSYADNGQVLRRFQRNGESLEQAFDFSIAYVRPNKLRMDCYGARVVIDGKDFYASVPQVANIVLKVAAPQKITPEDVVSDLQLGATLLQGPAGPPPQLPLLTADGTVAHLLAEAKSPPKLLSPESIDSQACNRVEVEMPNGPMVMWIDQQSNLLRRLELPPSNAAAGLDQGQEKTTSLVVNCNNAQINQPIDDVAFKFEVPEGAKVSGQLVEELKPAEIAPHSDPAALKLTKLWTAADLKDPGNVLVVEGKDKSPRVLVFDGARVVAEVDQDGKTVARHDLDIPTEAMASYLRTAVDGKGNRVFAACASGQSQLYVFDDAWKLVLTFPKPEDSAGAKIGGVQLADLTGDGTQNLYVGYWGDVGLQGVSLDGNRLWRERTLQFALPCTTTDPDADGKRKLLCTHSRGTIVAFGAEGKPQGEIVVPNRFVGVLYGADLKGDNKNSYCALAITPDGTNEAVGISLDGQQLWNYALPSGVSGRPVETVTTGDVAGDGSKQWLLAGADGSVHILAADGKPLDKFNTGSGLTGLAAANFGDKHVLLIASLLEKPDGDKKGVLEAWQVEPVGK